jgi:hypothetical protein
LIVPYQRLAAEDREQPLVIALKCPLMHDEFDH